MEFKEALEKLGIEKYAERIYNSNSHGELFHLNDYIIIAKAIKTPGWFAGWFEIVVKDAEETWKRPESVFQHIPKILNETLLNKNG